MFLQKELIRTVDLGPFKHTVDDGLELRKAAFECVDTLLDNCLDQLNPSSFIVPYLKSGLDGKLIVILTCFVIGFWNLEVARWTSENGFSFYWVKLTANTFFFSIFIFSLFIFSALRLQKQYYYSNNLNL